MEIFLSIRLFGPVLPSEAIFQYQRGYAEFLKNS